MENQYFILKTTYTLVPELCNVQVNRESRVAPPSAPMVPMLKQSMLVVCLVKPIENLVMVREMHTFIPFATTL
jgi:hypothetical protein